MAIPDQTRLNLSAGLASVIVASVLVLLKLWALGETGALSVAASLADSAMDLMVSVGAMAAIFYAARPPDEDHAFGHTSAEDIAALGQSIFVLVSAGVIAVAAVLRLVSRQPDALSAEGRGMAVMTVSVVLTIALVIWQGRVARRDRQSRGQRGPAALPGRPSSEHRGHRVALGLGALRPVPDQLGGGAGCGRDHGRGRCPHRQGRLRRADGPPRGTRDHRGDRPDRGATGRACAAITTSRPGRRAAGCSSTSISNSTATRACARRTTSAPRCAAGSSRPIRRRM